MDKIKFMCWKCGKDIVFNGTLSRSSECPECGSDLRCCKNCDFYQQGSHYDCRESIEDPVFDKEKANFCDSFRLRTSFGGSTPSTLMDKQKKAKADFDSLFSI